MTSTSAHVKAMNAILPQEIDFEIPDSAKTDYFANIRRFKTGSLEMVVRVVKPMAVDLENLWATQGGGALPSKKEERTKEEQEAIDRRNKARSARRAKQMVRWLVLEQGFNRLVTLTYRENVEDREKVKTDFKKFLRYVRHGWKGQYGYPDWRFVAVLERQERGAYHVHIAVKGHQNINMLRRAWYKALGASEDVSGENTPGQVDIQAQKTRWGESLASRAGRQRKEWSLHKLAGYLCKYLHKTFDETAVEKRRYWHSKGLEVPKKERIWVAATNIVDAIKQARSAMVFEYGLKAGCTLWISDDATCFWLSGVCDEMA